MRFEIKQDLSKLRAEVRQSINAQAGEVRKLFITDTSGQDMVYFKKKEEAETLVRDPETGVNVSENLTPHINREALRAGITRYEMAVIVLSMEHAWTQASVEIEDRRLLAVAAVDAAQTAPEIRSAGNVDWSDLKALAP